MNVLQKLALRAKIATEVGPDQMRPKPPPGLAPVSLAPEPTPTPQMTPTPTPTPPAAGVQVASLNAPSIPHPPALPPTGHIAPTSNAPGRAAPAPVPFSKPMQTHQQVEAWRTPEPPSPPPSVNPRPDMQPPRAPTPSPITPWKVEPSTLAPGAPPWQSPLKGMPGYSPLPPKPEIPPPPVRAAPNMTDAQIADRNAKIHAEPGNADTPQAEAQRRAEGPAMYEPSGAPTDAWLARQQAAYAQADRAGGSEKYPGAPQVGLLGPNEGPGGFVPAGGGQFALGTPGGNPTQSGPPAGGPAEPPPSGNPYAWNRPVSQGGQSVPSLTQDAPAAGGWGSTLGGAALGYRMGGLPGGILGATLGGTNLANTALPWAQRGADQFTALGKGIGDAAGEATADEPVRATPLGTPGAVPRTEGRPEAPAFQYAGAPSQEQRHQLAPLWKKLDSRPETKDIRNQIRSWDHQRNPRELSTYIDDQIGHGFVSQKEGDLLRSTLLGEAKQGSFREQVLQSIMKKTAHLRTEVLRHPEYDRPPLELTLSRFPVGTSTQTVLSLQKAARFGTPEDVLDVRNAVVSLYPDLGVFY